MMYYMNSIFSSLFIVLSFFAKNDQQYWKALALAGVFGLASIAGAVWYKEKA